MKKIVRFSWTRPMIGAVLCAFLLSFSFGPGAHSFQVFLDGKLVLDQYVNSKIEVPKLWLDPAESHNQLIVKYNECGRTVTGRKLTIKDDKGNVLKEFRFEGRSSGYKESMTCGVKDIIALNQKGNNELKLYYSSYEFPEGQLVVRLVLGSGPKTAIIN